jgi:phosphatidylserine/phosphatidylglycerophosphate/cardiolipin synthase-like enzyme
MSAMLVKEDGLESARKDKASLGLEVARGCTLEPYERIRVPDVEVSDEIIAYASPDSTYTVTKRFLDAATKSIVIGIYDFTAIYIQNLLLEAMQRGVKVSLMLDLDGRTGEQPMFDKLERFGAKAVPAPSCASANAQFFPSSHLKVIVIDGEWTLVQSGNYSDHSIPLNPNEAEANGFKTGNRDTGLAVKSKKLAAFFSKVINADMKKELDAAGLQRLSKIALQSTLEMVEAAPAARPEKLFKSKTFKLTSPLSITPILSPDNYMVVVPMWLEQARHSILIEQQYIKGKHEQVRTLLEAIQTARQNNPDLDIRIILGKVWKVQDEQANLDLIAQDFDLKVGKHIRYIDTKRLTHCHNKMILIDGQGVLVSSQNWSNTGVDTNREAGLLLEHKGIAQYFTEIFEVDWKTAMKKLGAQGPQELGPEALRSGKYTTVNYGDYAEV